MQNVYQVKIPVLIVHFDQIPTNSANKPLRIGLASRLSLPELTDTTSDSAVQFEATCPAATADSRSPIECRALFPLSKWQLRSVEAAIRCSFFRRHRPGYNPYRHAVGQPRRRLSPIRHAVGLARPCCKMSTILSARRPCCRPIGHSVGYCTCHMAVGHAVCHRPCCRPCCLP